MHNGYISKAIGEYAFQTKKEEALQKADYWKKFGVLVLASDLSAAWIQFVDSRVNNEFDRGMYMDEIIQILLMIKSGFSCEVIADVAKEIPDIDSILDVDLVDFVQPEILNAIKSNIETRTA